MEYPAPHTLMRNSRRTAVYIDSKNKWFPARDYQEESIKDFIEVINKYADTYKRMYNDNISIKREITKKYNPLPDVFFNLSFDILSNVDDFTINIDTFNIENETFITHLAIVYHDWDTIESIKEQEPIKKMGELSDELCEILRKNND